MGLCLCKQLIEDDLEISEIHKVEVAMKILRNKIKTKKMPIIWLEGTEGSGKLNHACNIAQRFDYSHIQVENLIKKGAEKMNRRGKYIKHKLMANRKLPDRLIIELIKEEMISTNECNGFLISGFPRNPKQASLFVRDIAPIDCMFYLEGQATDSSYSLDKSIGDSHSQEEGDKVQDEGDNLNETAKTTDSKVLVGKYDGLLERINASEPPGDVFLKIEAAILDRTTGNIN